MTAAKQNNSTKSRSRHRNLGAVVILLRRFVLPFVLLGVVVVILSSTIALHNKINWTTDEHDYDEGNINYNNRYNNTNRDNTNRKNIEQQEEQQPKNSSYYSICNNGSGTARTRSVSYIWTHYIVPQLLEWSQQKNKPPYYDRQQVETKSILETLTPSLLRKGIVNSMHHHDMRHLLQKLEAHLRHPSHHPPLQVLILGGSVAWGQNCNIDTKKHRMINTNFCRWSSRLEYIWKETAVLWGISDSAIQIHNLAVGGTDQEYGNHLLEFGLWPMEIGPKGPDIIINEYSTNEMMLLPSSTTKNENDISDRLFSRMQRFIRGSLDGEWGWEDHNYNNDTGQSPQQSHQYSCRYNKQKYKKRHRPVILYLDDYLGNAQHSILDTMQFNSVLYRLSTYYEIPALSYANTIRHVVYRNTTQAASDGSQLVPKWYRKKSHLKRHRHTPHTYQREVHPPALAHLAMTYVVLFGIVSFVTDFCHDEHDYDYSVNKKYQTEDEKQQDHNKLQMETTTKATVNVLRVLPPLLDHNLLLPEISDKWKQTTTTLLTTTSSCHDLNDTNNNSNSNNNNIKSSESPLPPYRCKSKLAWMSRLGVAGQSATSLNQTLIPFLDSATVAVTSTSTSGDGWAVRNDHKRVKVHVPVWSYSKTKTIIPTRNKDDTTNSTNTTDDETSTSSPSFFDIVLHKEDILNDSTRSSLVLFVTLLYVRSYQKEWKDSVVRLSLVNPSSTPTKYQDAAVSFYEYKDENEDDNDTSKNNDDGSSYDNKNSTTQVSSSSSSFVDLDAYYSPPEGPNRTVSVTKRIVVHMKFKKMNNDSSTNNDRDGSSGVRLRFTALHQTQLFKFTGMAFC